MRAFAEQIPNHLTDTDVWTFQHIFIAVVLRSGSYGALTDTRHLLSRVGIDVTRWPRRPEAGVIDWALAEVIRSRGINCVIDVGGNRGQSAQRLRSLGYTGRIVSFEPSPTVLPIILAAADKDPDWTVRPVALSSQAGQADLRLHKGPELDSLLDSLPGVVDQVPDMEAAGTATITLSTLGTSFPRLSPGSRTAGTAQVRRARSRRGSTARRGRGGTGRDRRSGTHRTDRPADLQRAAPDDRGHGPAHVRRVHPGRFRAVLRVIRRAPGGRVRRRVPAPGRRPAGLGHEPAARYAAPPVPAQGAGG